MKLFLVRSVLIAAFPVFFWVAVFVEAFRAGYREAIYQGRDFLRVWDETTSKIKRKETT